LRNSSESAGRKMLVVDAMLWVYNCDARAPEYENVHSWLEGEDGEGIINTQEILISPIIVMEVVHNLRRRARLPPQLVYDYVLKMLALKNVTTAPFEMNLLHASMHVFERYYENGIGGRDSTILATMLRRNADTIATHDKNILQITDFRRIDPTYHPPKIFDFGQSA